jgi:probable F420-dependent oxidoreductase
MLLMGSRHDRFRDVQIGVVYPQTELPPDPGVVRTYIHAVEELGYQHILTYDHVLGADPEFYRDWRGPYDVATTFHEPLVFYGFVAAITRMQLVTGILIAPQRQTALLAKQAAEVDILTGGRFRLGIGVGWNAVEYEALGQDFTTRGRRQEEQIILMRRLWTEPTVIHHGRFDRVVGAGLAPLPVQRPIPIWLGGKSTAAYRRIGRLADGWFPQVDVGPELDTARTLIAQAAAEAGRELHGLGLERVLTWGSDGVEGIARRADEWQNSGATHLALNTMGMRTTSVDAHLELLVTAAEALIRPSGVKRRAPH